MTAFDPAGLEIARAPAPAAPGRREKVISGPRSGHRPAASGAGFVIVLAALSAFGPLTNDTYLPAFPRISKIATSASATQATLTSVLVGLAIGQLLAGPISNSYGRMRPLLVGVVGFALTSGLCGRTDDMVPDCIPRAFAVAFGANALGIGVIAHLNGRLAEHTEPNRLLATGLLMSAVGGVSVLVCALTHGGLALMLGSLFVAVSAIGFVLPNATALALAGETRTAGSASALLGLTMYLLGGAVAPLVGVAGRTTAIPLGLVMATLGSLAVVSFAVLVVQPSRATPA